MGVLNRIESMENELSIAELSLYNYIQTHPGKVPSMTAEQLGQAAKVSAPTVVRFVKKVGFQSFTDFKMQLSVDNQQPLTGQGYADLAPGASINELKRSFSRNAQVTIKETAEILKEEALLAAIQLIQKKERLFVAGVGASELVAIDIQQKWSRLGNSVTVTHDYNSLLPQLVNKKEQSLLWLISNSGATPEILHLGETAKDLGIPIITMTRLGNNPLSKLGDVSLQVSRGKESDLRSAATNSIVAHLMAIDLLFYIYIGNDHNNAKKVRQSYHSVQEYRQNYL